MGVRLRDLFGTRSARGSGDDPVVNAARSTTTTGDGVLRAPDGMEINAPSTRPPQPLSRADVIARAKTADVPQRVQQGPTCGLYALGMVMDFWHKQDSRCAAPLVSDADLGGQGRHYNFEPTTDERILDHATRAGFTAQGEMFTARQLGQTAAHFGYTASVHDGASLDDLYRVLDAGHPAIVAFDVDRNGNPGDFGGQRAHYAVIEGYFDQDGERYLVAKHGWGVEKDHVWRAVDFERSFNALHTTDYYGTPGDGVIPNQPRLREPAHLDLPDAGGGRARIERSLNAKIVEVVPPGATVVGGELLAP
jgi:hypothetical protein